MILTGGLGFGGGLAARGYGAWIGAIIPDVVIPERPGGAVGGKIRNARISRLIERDDEEIMELFTMLFAGGAIQ